MEHKRGRSSQIDKQTNQKREILICRGIKSWHVSPLEGIKDVITVEHHTFLWVFILKDFCIKLMLVSIKTYNE